MICIALLCLLGGAYSASLDGADAKLGAVVSSSLDAVLPLSSMPGSVRAVSVGCPNDKSTLIRQNQFCDGVKDCSDGSDEICHTDCGVPAIKPDLMRGQRIVNGKEAIPHSWPWQIAMLYDDDLLCGGSLIGGQWVLTAAHCCAAVLSVSRLHVLVGAHNHEQPESWTHKIKVKNMLSHPRYNSPRQYANDFCLLHLQTGAPRKEQITPICLPRGSFLRKDNTTCFVTGWGTLRQGQPGGVAKLRQTTIDTYNRTKCNTIAEYRPADVTEEMFCGYREGTDTCQGDSGGPFACIVNETAGQFDLYGVTSWGYGCAQRGVPGVYALTSMSLDWIADTLYKAKYEGWPNSAVTAKNQAAFLIVSVVFAVCRFF